MGALGIPHFSPLLPLALSWICTTSSPILPLPLKGAPVEKLSHKGREGRMRRVRASSHTHPRHAGSVPFQTPLLLLFKEVAFLVPGDVGVRLCC